MALYTIYLIVLDLVLLGPTFILILDRWLGYNAIESLATEKLWVASIVGIALMVYMIIDHIKVFFLN